MAGSRVMGVNPKPRANFIELPPMTEPTVEPRPSWTVGLHSFVLDNLREGVSVSNESGVIVYTNAAEDQMFGYDRGELIGKHVTIQNSYSREENERIVRKVIDQLQQTGVWEGEWDNRRKDGTSFATYARITAFEAHGAKYWVCVQEDITERRRARERKRFVDGAAALLQESLTEERTLARFARYCIPFLADYCSVDILTEDGEVRRIETAHRDPGKEQIVRDLWARYPYKASDKVGVPQALRTGEPQFQPQWPLSDVEAFARSAEHLDLLRTLGPRSYICVPLIARGKAFGAISLVFSDSGRTYTRDDLILAASLAERASVAVDNTRLFAAEQKARRASETARERATFLAEASERLAASLDYAITLNTVARLAVPKLADWCFVQMVTEEGAIEPLAVVHSDPQKVEAALDLFRRKPIDPAARYGSAEVLRTGVPILAPFVPPEALEQVAQDNEHLLALREMNFKSHVSVPLIIRNKPVGVLSLAFSESDRVYGSDDLTLAVDLAHRASTAIDNAWLYRAEQSAHLEAEAARTRAEDASRAKSQFVATMSHELRTPLNAIAGHAQLLEMEVHGPLLAEQREAVARITRAQRYLLGLINDVLNFAKLEGGRVEYDIRDVLVHDIIGEIAPLLETQFRAKLLDFAVVLPEATITVRADSEKLSQVLVNLLSNAAKFTPAGGTITLALAGDHQTATIDISDTGIGIPADKIDAVFEPFVQLNASYNHRAEGTGLGLTISRDLVRGMGGELTVRSSGSQGTTFTITLERGPAMPGSA